MKHQIGRRLQSRLTAFTLGLALVVSIVPGVCADPQSATDDLWDLSQGAVVTGSSAITAGFDARDILGGLFGTVDDGQCIFLDNQPPGFVHYLEWQTPAPVTVGGFALFAEGDGPGFNNQREFEQFVLKAKSSPDATDYDLTLFTYDVPSHPYEFVDPANRMLILTNFVPVTSAFFRAEFVQYTAGTGFEAPRVWELDGYPLEPIITAPPTNRAVTVQGSAILTVKAIGLPPLFYQWRFEGSDLDGATNAILTLNQVQFQQAGNYSVVVTNAFGGTNSLDAVLTVNPAPPCIAAPTNLISWWPADDSAADQISGNHGALVGDATFAPGLLGQGFVFDGDGDFVLLGNSAALQSQEFTIEAWIQRGSPLIVSSSGSGSALIFGYGFGGYGFGLLNDGRLFLTKVGISNVTLPNGVTDTGWHHVVATKTGSTVVFYIDGLAYPAPPYDPGFTFATPAAIGARPDNQDGSFLGMIDEPSFYSRALTPSEIQTAFAAGLSGKCPDPVPPTIVSHPRNTNVIIGATMAFNVVAGGSPPLTYQWRLGGMDINGATNASLIISNVQSSSIGLYSVLVTNQAGSVVSRDAALNMIFPPANVRILATNVMAGGPVVLPVTLAATGNEHAIGFSLNFSAQRLAFDGITLGSGAVGASLIANTSMTATGRLGVSVVFPFQASFAPGTQEVVRVNFRSLPVLGIQPANTTVSFVDQPILRELSDTQLQTSSANYFNTSFLLSPTVFEGDVSPRTNGNQNVSTTDWLQMGRFVARLDSIASTNEFRRADCAPRSNLGDGQLKVTDWVQASRYLAGFDPLVAIGGPTIETAPTTAGPSANRRMLIANTSVTQIQIARIMVNLEAQGDEHALGFTVAFDPVAFTFSGIEPGNAATGANFLLNTSQVGNGKLGVVLALGDGRAFSAGTREVVKVNLVATAATGVFPLMLTDQVVTRCVSGADADELPVSFASGSITVTSTNPPPTLAIVRSNDSAKLSWPVWAGDFTLQMVDTIDGVPGGWTNLSGPFQTNGGDIHFTIPVTNPAQLFRLRR